MSWMIALGSLVVMTMMRMIMYCFFFNCSSSSSSAIIDLQVCMMYSLTIINNDVLSMMYYHKLLSYISYIENRMVNNKRRFRSQLNVEVDLVGSYIQCTDRRYGSTLA